MRDDYNASIETWATLLAVSTRFVCFDIHRRALSALISMESDPGALSPIDQLRLAVKYEIASWFAPTYSKIVRSNYLLTAQDTDHLPVSIVVLLLRSTNIYHHRDNWVTLNGHDASASVDFAPKRSAEDIIAEQISVLGIDWFGRRSRYAQYNCFAPGYESVQHMLTSSIHRSFP